MVAPAIQIKNYWLSSYLLLAVYRENNVLRQLGSFLRLFGQIRVVHTVHDGRLGLTLEFSLNLVDIFQMTAKIATLRKVLVTNMALEGSEASVLTEVVSEIAAFLEDALAILEAALEEELDALGLWVPHLHRFVPRLGDSLESLRIDVICLSDFVLLIIESIMVHVLLSGLLGTHTDRFNFLEVLQGHQLLHGFV